ncbi:hypothetical protein MTO96_011560 [Rhipicephalus appendiculatus]
MKTADKSASNGPWQGDESPKDLAAFEDPESATRTRGPPYNLGPFFQRPPRNSGRPNAVHDRSDGGRSVTSRPWNP